MKKQILDCSSVFTFVVKKYPCKKEEINEQLKNFYPFSVKGKSIVVRGIKKRKETVFFIFKKTSFDTEWVSFVLFILNRYKEGNYGLKKDSVWEVVSISKNGPVSLNITDREPDNCKKVFLASEILDCSTKEDCIHLHSDKSRLKKRALRVLFMAVMIPVLLAGVKTAVKEKKEKLLDSIKLEKQKKEKEEERISRLKEVQKLEEEYLKLCENRTPSVYEILQHIYGLCSKGDGIKNLSIEKNYFSFEAGTENGVELLKKMERDSFFLTGRINRIQKNGNREEVSLSGEVKKIKTEIIRISDKAPESVINEKIEHYRKKISEIEEQKSFKEKQVLSVFMESVKKELRKNNCKEEYFIESTDDSRAVVEVLFRGSPENVFSVVKKMGQQDRELIKVLKINSFENSGEIQCTLVFDTGIMTKREMENKPSEAEFTPKEISKAFYCRKETVKRPVQQQKKTVLYEQKKLDYLGSAKNGNKKRIFVSDRENGLVFELLEEKTDSGKDHFYFREDGGLIAVLKNKEFEVNW